MTSTVVFNKITGRYEMTENGAQVHARVRRENGILYIDYVEADSALRGSGAAGRFMAELMEIVRAEGLKAVPICGYAAAWLRKHPAYNDLRAG